jgi:hypothetical protein
MNSFLKKEDHKFDFDSKEISGHKVGSGLYAQPISLLRKRLIGMLFK